MPKIKDFERKSASLQGTTQTRGGHLSINKTDTENRTLDFVFVSDDNTGKRYDYGSGEYYDETLDVNGANVESLRTFFKNHNRDVEDAIGKIANARVENGQLIGEVTFGSDPVSDGIFRKYVDGILTDVSIGYTIKDFSVKRGSENERDSVTVTDFDIFEVSAVGIGFDSNAKKRYNDDEVDTMTKEQLQRLKALEKQATFTDGEKTELRALKDEKARLDVEAGKEAKRLKDENVELKRQADIMAVHAKYPLEDEALNRFIGDKEATADTVRQFLLAEKERGSTQFSQSSSDEADKLRESIRDGLAIRLGATLKDATAEARQYVNTPLATLANLMLPEDQRSYNPLEVAERSMLVGDFPNLLINAGNRMLTAEFERQNMTYAQWVRQVDVPDFRFNTDITTGQGGRLDETLENGDLKELSLAEKAESWKLKSFGNKIAITREMIINDDLGAFQDMLSLFAQKASATANGLSYDLLRNVGAYSAYKMADNTAVFSAAHGNKTSVELSSAAITAGKVAMRKQKGIDGKTPLNITPRYLIVGAGLEDIAYKIVNSTTALGATNDGEVNTLYKTLTVIVDSELNDTEWYLAAERRTIKVGFLQGTNRKPVIKVNSSSSMRTIIEGVFDFGLVVEDYRGLFQGNQ